jgi:hypothetical protein
MALCVVVLIARLSPGPPDDGRPRVMVLLELPEQKALAEEPPVLSELAVLDTTNTHIGEANEAARRGEAEELAAVRTGGLEVEA